MKVIPILFLQLVLICINVSAKDYSIESPDKKISINIDVSETILWSVIMYGKR